MTVVNVVVPAVGESVQEGMIHKWHKQDGEVVSMDQVLLELETDKATVEIVAEVSGKLSQKRKQGDTVRVGDVLATIDTDVATATQVTEAATPQKVSPPVKTESTNTLPLSPAVNRMVKEHNVDPNELKGTGKDGRLTKGDVIAHIDSPKSPTQQLVKPSTPKQELPNNSSRGSKREPMTMLRRRIAERLIHAQSTNAILTTFNEIDMAPVMKLRASYKDKFKEKHGVGLGFMSFFVKAAIEGLKAFPQVNGHIDGNDIVTYNYFDVGVAISTERGLMVPVIRDADKLSFAGIESSIVRYAEKARGGKITVDDLSGGTFTITNGGVFGSLISTPIINPPQSAILGMHKIQDRAVVVDGQIVIRPMMYLAVSYDHRIIDGKEAVSFLVRIKDCLEDPARLVLEV